ncbi:MAG: TonB-dependent receptor [Tannerellaceae bacterium]|jgi:iron complex outermembrane receptor protein|nr:TonB-dependent receptor [Tannerellaceae bacterium]
MHIGYIPVMLMFVFILPPSQAQESDSLKAITLKEVVVQSSYKKISNLNSSQPVDVADKTFLSEHFTGKLTQALEHIPGFNSMEIGSGFSKPMIRGMGFNRISVTENGIKQEGQQWGADHGLEIDAFGVERVSIRKGPASLLYGSDAIGGAVEITQAPPPLENQFFGEVALLGKSVNETLGGSLMLGLKKNTWYTKLRFSEQYFGDYHIPADTVVYLTQHLPIEGERLKNTAGFERDLSWYSDYRNRRYYTNFAVSNAYQKVGFFAGAHGIPDASQLTDDGDSHNIELPYSTVNHLKITSRQQYAWDKIIGYCDMGFQNNHREEWSRFHTHYGTQLPPENDADKELEFSLKTFSFSAKIKTYGNGHWEHTVGYDLQYQQNSIAGYSFLLPEYGRFTSGFLWLSVYHLHPKVSVSGGIRYDYGRLNISAYRDAYLENYLREQGYDNGLIASYKWRSYPVNRNFGDISGSFGIVWKLDNLHLIKFNAGRSFRLPCANELASNGVHHGTFRHEQGDTSLSSEHGWQFDAFYTYEREKLYFAFTPFGSWFGNYVYLKPTGEWSALPHAGQIYRYTEAEAVFAGAEVECGFDFLHSFSFHFAGEYVYNHNLSEHISFPFSPPASMRNTLTWKHKRIHIWEELQSIAPQKRISKNEEATPGATLWNMGVAMNILLCKTELEITLSMQNMLNTKYYNHLSFYRKMEIPEAGHNAQILIKIPFKNKLK